MGQGAADKLHEMSPSADGCWLCGDVVKERACALLSDTQLKNISGNTSVEEVYC